MLSFWVILEAHVHEVGALLVVLEGAGSACPVTKRTERQEGQGLPVGVEIFVHLHVRI